MEGRLQILQWKCEKCTPNYKRGDCLSNSKGTIQKVKLLFYKVANNYYNRLLHGIEIPLNTKIGKGLRLIHLNGIAINKCAIIGKYVTIFQQVTIGAVAGKDGAPEIGNKVYIGAGAKLLGPIKIGDGVRVVANAVVTKDIPSNATVVGCNQIIKGNEDEKAKLSM